MDEAGSFTCSTTMLNNHLMPRAAEESSLFMHTLLLERKIHRIIKGSAYDGKQKLGKHVMLGIYKLGVFFTLEASEPFDLLKVDSYSLATLKHKLKYKENKGGTFL